MSDCPACKGSGLDVLPRPGGADWAIPGEGTCPDCDGSGKAPEWGLPEHLDNIAWTTDYFELLAITKSWKPWWFGKPRLWPLIWMGDDEYRRRTLVIGPIVFPLWRCRCKDCRAELAELRARVEKP